MTRELPRGLKAIAHDLADHLNQPYTENPPVPIEKLVQEANGTVIRCVMPSEGSTTFAGDRFSIRVSTSARDAVKRGRERFTIAHELGHVMWRRLMERSDEGALLSDHPFQKRRIEDLEEPFCDVFAASVLVPTEVLRARENNLRIDGLIHDSFKWCVSLAVMGWKAVDLVADCLGAAWLSPGRGREEDPFKVSVEWSVFADPRNEPPKVLAFSRNSVPYDSLFHKRETVIPNVRIGFGHRKWPYTIHLKRVGRKVFGLFLHPTASDSGHHSRLTDFDEAA